MNKIKNFTVLFFLLLLSNCAYEPILNNKNHDFSIVVEKIDGDKKINSMIVNNFYNLKGKEIKYNLNLSSTKIKNVISKDSKGDPAIFELIINVNYSVKKNEETLLVNEINLKEEEILNIAKNLKLLDKHLNNKTINKVIFVKNRLINILVNE